MWCRVFNVLDKSGIHFRMLNESKGEAVHGPRAQIDRTLYKQNTQKIMLDYPNLEIMSSSVESLITDPGNSTIVGVGLGLHAYNFQRMEPRLIAKPL